MRAPSGSCAMRTASALRTTSMSWMALTQSSFGDDHRDSDAAVMAERDVPVANTEFFCCLGDGSLHIQQRSAVIASSDLCVVPLQGVGGPERLGQRLLRRKTRSERWQRQGTLGVGEKSVREARGTRHRRL